MELWDLYDRQGGKTGRIHRRGVPLPPGFYHLVVNIWIADGNGRFLMAKRALDKEPFPGLWECQGGSVLAGESSLQGALREAHEEVGAPLDPQKGMLWQRVTFKEYGMIKDIWLFLADPAGFTIIPQPGEVSQARWMREEEIRALHLAGELVPLKTYDERLFAHAKAMCK